MEGFSLYATLLLPLHICIGVRDKHERCTVAWTLRKQWLNPPPRTPPKERDKGAELSRNHADCPPSLKEQQCIVTSRKTSDGN